MGFQDEELPIVSSSPLVDTAPAQPKAQDELDMPALKKIQKTLAAQIASYSTIERLTVDETDLSIKEQLAVNKCVAHHLTEVKLLVDTVINNIKEQYE